MFDAHTARTHAAQRDTRNTLYNTLLDASDIRFDELSLENREASFHGNIAPRLEHRAVHRGRSVPVDELIANWFLIVSLYFANEREYLVTFDNISMELYRTNWTSQTGFRNRRNSRCSTQLRFCLEDIGCRVGRLVDPGNPITRSGIVHVVPFFLQSRKTKSSPPRGVLTIRTCLRIRFTTSTPFLFFLSIPFLTCRVLSPGANLPSDRKFEKRKENMYLRLALLKKD